MDRRISVIIPCFNVEKYIDECMESVLDQTIGFENLEIILVNDASTDGTSDKLAAYEKSHEENIILINLDERGKVGTARNVALEYASCPYIGFVDADDVIEPDMFEKLYNNAVKYDCDISQCQWDRAYRNKITAGQRVNDELHIIVESKSDRQRLLESGLSGNLWNKIYKRELISDSGVRFPDNMVYEDNYWLNIIGFYAKNVYISDEVLYHWIVNEESVTTTHDIEGHLDRLKIEEMIVNELKIRGFYEEYEDYIKRNFMERYFFNSLHVFFTRLDSLPISVFNRIKDGVKSIVPDYKTFMEYPKGKQSLINLIDVDLLQEDIDEIREIYLTTL